MSDAGVAAGVLVWKFVESNGVLSF
jgi:hypothetical protein